MKRYQLYLESGPKHRKTMVHVLDLPGLTANGSTTEAALDATPDAIRAYLRFFARRGDMVDPDEPFETEVAEHITEGDWLGNGSPYLIFTKDLEPMTAAGIEDYMQRFVAVREALAAWVGSQTDEELDVEPGAKGRTARSILLHVLGPTGSYISAVVGGTSGFSRIQALAERGEMPLADALRQTAAMVVDLVRATTPEQRSAVIEGPSQVRTLRKGLRRTLEHDWEHLEELSRRPGGPQL